MSIPVIISLLALVVSAISVWFTRRSWRETYRPIIVARVTTVSAGNLATCYNLLIENCGNRPARNVRIRVDENALRAALNPQAKDDPEAIWECFSEKALIHVLANGCSTTAFFGATAVRSPEATWIPDSRFETEVTYEGFDGVKYSERIPLQISLDTSFTGWSWGKEKSG